jgi:hypothetical protein
LNAVGVRDGEVVGADAHEFAVLVVQFFELVVAVEGTVADDVVELGEACKERPGEFVEGVEEEAVGQEGDVEAKEVAEEVGEGGAEGKGGGDGEVVRAGDGDDGEGEEVGLDVAHGIEMAFAVFVVEEVGSNAQAEGGTRDENCGHDGGGRKRWMGGFGGGCGRKLGIYICVCMFA